MAFISHSNYPMSLQMTSSLVYSSLIKWKNSTTLDPDSDPLLWAHLSCLNTTTSLFDIRHISSREREREKKLPLLRWFHSMAVCAGIYHTNNIIWRDGSRLRISACHGVWVWTLSCLSSDMWICAQNMRRQETVWVRHMTPCFAWIFEQLHCWLKTFFLPCKQEMFLLFFRCFSFVATSHTHKGFFPFQDCYFLRKPLFFLNFTVLKTCSALG